jgi:hypothetical protein
VVSIGLPYERDAWQVVVNVVVDPQVQKIWGIVSFWRRAVLLGDGHVILSESRSVWQQ